MNTDAISKAKARVVRLRNRAIDRALASRKLPYRGLKYTVFRRGAATVTTHRRGPSVVVLPRGSA